MQQRLLAEAQHHEHTRDAVFNDLWWFVEVQKLEPQWRIDAQYPAARFHAIMMTRIMDNEVQRFEQEKQQQEMSTKSDTYGQ